jgi:polysaccharide pyruvyl transferase CsaB
MSARIRALALGYQGFGNVGDEAILAGLEEVLAESPVQVVAVIGGPEPIPAFVSATRITTHRMRPTLAGLRALRRTGLVLVSGGGLLNDHWLTVVPTYLAWSVLARVAGARIAWIGVGVGPLRRPLSRRLAGWALALASCVTVRDPESAALAATIARHVTVTVVPDPALLMSRPAPRDRKGIGLIVREPTPDRFDDRTAMAQALADTGARLADNGTAVRLITFGGPRDLRFAEEIRDRAMAAGAILAGIDELGPDPGEALDAIASLEAAVSVRLHGVILAALASTPVVPIAYDEKVRSVARLLGMQHLTQAIDGLSGEGIAAALQEAASVNMQKKVWQSTEGLRSSGTRLRRLIEQAVR